MIKTPYKLTSILTSILILPVLVIAQDVNEVHITNKTEDPSELEIDDKNLQSMHKYVKACNEQDIHAIKLLWNNESQDIEKAGNSNRCDDWFPVFTDFTYTIDEFAMDGDRILGRAIIRGIQSGTYKGIPPTENEVEVVEHFYSQFKDGLIIKHHTTTDIYSILRQIGVTMPPESVKEEENKALVRQYFTALNERDREAFRATLADDFSYGSIQDADAMVESDFRWLAMFDLNWEIQAMHADGDFVTTRLIATGKHKETFRGIEPTGKSFEITATTVSRIEDGKVAEWWGEWNFASLLRQTGLMNSPAYD